MRIIYSALFYISVPFILLRLLWRGRKIAHYRCRWHERFACYQNNARQHVLWFHAVSVGEAEAVFPLVRLFQQRLPDYPILVTTTTPTGSARVQAVLADSVQHTYLPYDLPDAVGRFIDHFKPRMAIIMETEIWPNLFHQCGKKAIPVYIVNARLSEKSADGYQKLSSLTISSLAQIKIVAAQTQEDAQRYVEIGADRQKVLVAGNIKFDLVISDTVLQQGTRLKETIFQGRKVWIVASTHKGEEELFVRVYSALKKYYPDLLMVIVPRHPDRFDDVQKLCTKAQLNVIKRTANTTCVAETDVYLADTMGELKMLYAASDIAFVAGSMQAVGGHNVLEAAALGVPVLFGPHMFNFKEIAHGLLAEKAAIQCQDRQALEKNMRALLDKPQYAKQLGAKGKDFILKNQGALEGVYALIVDGLGKP